MNQYLISDPEERKERALEKETAVLKWLKDEIFSTTAILAGVMGVQERAARTVLNRLADRGLIIKDAVPLIAGRALAIWGITPAGLWYILDEKEIATASLRYHSPGSIKSVTIEHALKIQECRFYFCAKFRLDSWVPDRLLPGKGLKVKDPKRWPLYPDAVFTYTNAETSKKGSVAIEYERSRKTSLRYSEIIKAHLKNIEKGRYSVVWYICPTTKEVGTLKGLFTRLIQEKKISLFMNDDVYYGPDKVLQLFIFKSLDEFYGKG